MTELQLFDAIWNGSFERSIDKKCSFYPFTARGAKKKKEWENILFSIWAHHQDWKEVDGFEIKCRYESPLSRTLYRVRELAENAGLLIRVGNYSTGDHTNYYKKNNRLFDAVFKGKNNEFGKWIIESHNKPEIDIIYNIKLSELDKLNADNDFNLFTANYAENSNRIKKRRKPSRHIYIYELKKLCKTMLPYYYDLMTKLNNSVIHDKLKLTSFVYFDENDEPRGRPTSYFCSTLNPDKKHKSNTGIMRPDFLKMIGIPDYYEVYDIKSEIPRVNYLFNTGVWKDDDYDFYTEMIKDVEIFKFMEWQVQRGKAGELNYNDSMKQIFMRIYFGRGTDLQSFNGYMKDRKARLLLNHNAPCWIDAMQLPKKERIKTMLSFSCVNCLIGEICKYSNNCEAYQWLENMELERMTGKFAPRKTIWKEDMDLEIWSEIANSVRKICGSHFLQNLAFWFSFFIQTEVKIELLNRGKKVYNVHDAFYFNKDIKEEIKEILQDKAIYVFNKYMIPINNQLRNQ